MKVFNSNDKRLLSGGLVCLVVLMGATVASAAETKCIWDERQDSGMKNCKPVLEKGEKLIMRCPRPPFELSCRKPMKDLKATCEKDDLLSPDKIKEMVPGYTVELDPNSEPGWPTAIAYFDKELPKDVKVYGICSNVARDQGWLVEWTFRGKERSSAAPSAASLAVLLAAVFSAAGVAAI